MFQFRQPRLVEIRDSVQGDSRKIAGWKTRIHIQILQRIQIIQAAN